MTENVVYFSLAKQYLFALLAQQYRMLKLNQLLPNPIQSLTQGEEKRPGVRVPQSVPLKWAWGGLEGQIGFV